jgi:hypothetical protein
MEAASPPPVAPPPVDKKVYARELVKLSDKWAASKTEYYKYFGIKWKKGQPEPTKDEQNKAFNVKVEELYDKVVGRDGANKERLAARAIKDAKPDETTRTEEEKALIAKTDVERNTFNTGEWMNKKAELFDTYSKLFDRYKLAYDCWINNGDRFTLPADIEQELKN